jgi:glucuronoarabinoxylan endo-1,4-beta-xylanase
MGNWGKFVRPGFVRVEATASPQDEVSVTAFREPEGDQFVIVAVNQRSNDVSQLFVLSGGVASEVVPWVTSASLALSERPAVSVDGDAFSYTLAASSVTTFVGEGDLDQEGSGTGGSSGTGGATGGEAGSNAATGGSAPTGGDGGTGAQAGSSASCRHRRCVRIPRP